MAIPMAAWAALSALGPGVLSGLFGRFDNPGKLRRQALGFLDPTNIQREGQTLFEGTLQSPGFNMARSDILGAGQTSQNAIQRQLGQTGLGRSGVGTAHLGAAAAAPGIQLGRMTGSAWDSAMRQAQGLAQGRVQTLMGMPQGQSPTMPLFGAGLNALLPFLFRMMQQQGGGGFDQGPGTPYGGGGNFA